MASLRSLRQGASGSARSRNDAAGGATPRIAAGGTAARDDDPFDEVHRDLATRRPPRPLAGEEEEGDDDFDRQFYLADDDEYLEDNNAAAAQQQTSSGNATHGRFIFESERTRAREAEMQRRRDAGHRPPPAGGQAGNLRQARQSALDRDQRAWEENRLLSSGAATEGVVDLDFANESDARVQLLVHQIRPPFLRGDGDGGGGASFSTVREAVPTVRDATSDFARMAREGSATLARLREKKERGGMRQKFWELGGSRMGDAMRVKEAGAGAKEDGEGGGSGEAPRATGEKGEKGTGELDYKKSAGFAAHVTKKDGTAAGKASSEFARTKSIREQREYLPAYCVRESLLNTIRENNIVIVVGKT